MTWAAQISFVLHEANSNILCIESILACLYPRCTSITKINGQFAIRVECSGHGKALGHYR